MEIVLEVIDNTQMFSRAASSVGETTNKTLRHKNKPPMMREKEQTDEQLHQWERSPAVQFLNVDTTGNPTFRLTRTSPNFPILISSICPLVSTHQESPLRLPCLTLVFWPRGRPVKTVKTKENHKKPPEVHWQRTTWSDPFARTWHGSADDESKRPNADALRPFVRDCRNWL